MCNSSIQTLNLVSCGVNVCNEDCLLFAGLVFVWCGAVGVLFYLFLALNIYRLRTEHQYRLFVVL
jgi:hypothetical protein